METPQSTAIEPPDRKVLRLLRYTIPVHGLLPIGLWLLGSHDQILLGQVLVGLHLLTLLLIVASYRWWRGHGVQLAAVILIDHAVTFTVGLALIALTADR